MANSKMQTTTSILLYLQGPNRNQIGFISRKFGFYSQELNYYINFSRPLFPRDLNTILPPNNTRYNKVLIWTNYFSWSVYVSLGGVIFFSPTTYQY